MKIGCCIDITHANALVANGYDTLSLAARDVVAWDEAQFEDVRVRLEGVNLERISLNGFGTADLRLDGTGHDPRKVRACIERLAPRARQLGYRYIGIGAPASRNLLPGDRYDECMRQFRYSMEMMAEIAGTWGVELLLESVCGLECNFIRTTREAIECLERWNNPNIHLVYDLYHEQMERQPLSVIAEAGPEIRVVHVAEDDGGRRAYLSSACVGTYAACWQALEGIGYRGEWNVEAFHGDPVPGIEESMRVMKAVRKATEADRGGVD